jgi:hypothetical protein
MSYERIKEHLDLVLMIAVVALGTAVVAGNSVLAAIITIAVGLLIVSLVGSRVRTADRRSKSPMRLDHGPFTFSYAWELEREPELGQIKDVLDSQGLNPRNIEGAGASLVFQTGSHLWTRLFGGYFVPLRLLPLRIELFLEHDETRGLWRLQMQVSDRFGLAVRDSTREARFADAANQIKETLEGEL